MIFLASTLGVMLKDDILTGQYLASLLLGSVPLFLLPCLFFAASLITTIATGGAWATFALMIAIAIPMIISLMQIATPASPEMLPLLFPILGGIFSGAVCGDHISPVSETTVMTATATNTTPIDHARTQAFYATPAIISCFIGFIIAGYLADYSLVAAACGALGSGLVICFSMLSVLNVRKRNQS